MFRYNNGIVFAIIMFLRFVVVVSASQSHAMRNTRYLKEAGTINPRRDGKHSKEVVFALDMTGSTTKNGLNEVISKTAKQMIIHQIPPGVSIGILQYGNKNMFIQNMTYMEDKHQREKITLKIKPESAAGDSSPYKGISMATSIMSNKGGSILILSDEPWNNYMITKRDEMKVLELKAMHHEVFNIVFSKGKHSDYKFNVQLLKYSNKSLIVNYEWMVSNPANILDTIISVDSVNWEMNTKNISIIIDSQELSIKQNDWYSEFIVESSCKGNCTLEISLQSVFQHEYCFLQLISPDGTVDKMNVDKDFDTYWQTYQNPLTGIWNISLSCTYDQKEKMLAFSVAETYDVKEYQFEKTSNLHFSCIACDEADHELEFGSILCFKGDNGVIPKPLVILAELRMNESPLENIEVIASVKELSNSSKNIKQTFTLHDGGWGADKTDSDGIYSGYFNPFENSSIQCGDQNKYCIFMFKCTAKGMVPGYGKFQRQNRGHIFKTKNQQESYFPSPIRDLKKSLLNCPFTDYQRGYNITWTSTEEFLSKETDLRYKFYLETDVDSVMIDGKRHSIDIHKGIFPIINSSKNFGETEFHSICMPEKANSSDLCLSVQSIVNNVETVSNRVCMPLTDETITEIPCKSENDKHFWWLEILLVILLVIFFLLALIVSIYYIKLRRSISKGKYVVQNKAKNIQNGECADAEREGLNTKFY